MQETEFQTVIDGMAVIPYHPQRGALKEDALLQLYHRLHEEELYPIVFHENPEMTALEFMNFFNMPRTLLAVLGIMEPKPEFAGMAWLSEVTNCQDVITRATGSFVYFKKFQTPKITTALGKRVLDFWFNHLKINTLVGVTPASNRVALAYIKRLGFKQCGMVPSFTTLFGSVTDAVVTVMTQSDWSKMEDGHGEIAG